MDTTKLVKTEAKPVKDRTADIIPAPAHAIAIIIVVFAPSSRASNIFFGVKQVYLFKKLTGIDTIIE